MNPSDFDTLLNEVLRDQAQAEPQPGIEQRILTRASEQAARSRRRLWAFGLSGASIAACLMLILAHPSRPAKEPGTQSPATSITSPTEAKSTHQAEMALNVPAALHLSAGPSLQRPPVKRVALRVHRKAGTTLRQMPKLNTFPAATQRSDDLLAAPPKTLQAFVELKASQQQPLQINTIEIQPL